MVGNPARPALVSTVQGATEGRHSSHPLASPCVKGHGPGARAQGRKRSLQQFAIFDADGSDFAAQLGENRDGAIPGSDENVFFFGLN